MILLRPHSLDGAGGIVEPPMVFAKTKDGFGREVLMILGPGILLDENPYTRRIEIEKYRGALIVHTRGESLQGKKCYGVVVVHFGCLMSCGSKGVSSRVRNIWMTTIRFSSSLGRLCAEICRDREFAMGFERFGECFVLLFGQAEGRRCRGRGGAEGRCTSLRLVPSPQTWWRHRCRIPKRRR